MRFPEPRIESRPDGDGVRVIVGYETPEMVRAMESLQAITTGALACMIALASTVAIWRTGDASTYAVLLTALGAIGAYAVARMIGQLAFRHRFWARQVTDRTLEVRFHRRVVTHGGQTYPRGPALRFTAVPHRDGRHEDRAERHAERLLTTTYREAWQVWLQHGEVFVLLADVSDEQGASADRGASAGGG